jgi:starch phosphorylase
MYYRRADDEIPHDFVQVMKESIKRVAPQFSTRRMVKEYVNRFYVEALGLNAVRSA